MVDTDTKPEIVTLSDGYTLRRTPPQVRWAMYDDFGRFVCMLSARLNEFTSAAYAAGKAAK